MATTTRIDTSPAAASNLGLTSIFWKRLDGKAAARWGGIGKARWACWTFRVRLPIDIGEAWELLGRCEAIAYTQGAQLGAALWTVEKKIREAIGWPKEPLTGDALEEGFRGAIIDSPRDLASWMAYADWLAEQGRSEADVIAEWLNPKTISQTERKEAKFRKRYPELYR